MNAPTGTASKLTGAAVFGNVPPGLRDELVNAFNEALRNYREGRWEPSELNGGKLCEVVYTILRGHVDGKFPAKAAKPRNMLDACKALEHADAARFPRSIRIQIPRMLVALYEIRNNRGVGHVGGDVDPNLMDATVVVAMSKWIIADLVRVFHAIPTDEAQEIVETLVERDLPLIWKVGDAVRILDPKMSATDKALVFLYQSRGWLEEATLRGWVEYANTSKFRGLLEQLHKKKLIEYDAQARRAILSPTGARHVEESIRLELS